MADRRKDRRLGLQKMFDDYIERLQNDFTSGAEQSAQGVGDIVERGNVLTGIPRIALGGLGWLGSPASAAVSPVLGPLLAPVAEATDTYVGQPVERMTGYPADLTNEIFLSTAIPYAGGKLAKASAPYLSRVADAAEAGVRKAGYTFARPEGALFSGAGPVKLADDEGITAYHGSPHSFDKFSMDKIGTGEGAQAYGHGLYFAENEGVARTYRDMLSDQPQALPAMDWQQRRGWTELQDEAYGLADKALEELQIDIAQGSSTRPSWANLRDKVRLLAPEGRENEILGELDSMANQYGWKEFVNKNPGSMYQVRLNVKPDELLDWDKPLSEQPEVVKSVYRQKFTPEDTAALQMRLDAVRERKNALAEDRLPNGSMRNEKDWHDAARESEAIQRQMSAAKSGQNLYRSVGYPDEQATAKLREAGVKGIRYKDAGSRGASGGTYNYVIFDDNLIDILKRYAVPFTVGAGGAIMVSGQDMPPELAAQMGGGT